MSERNDRHPGPDTGRAPEVPPTAAVPPPAPEPGARRPAADVAGPAEPRPAVGPVPAGPERVRAYEEAVRRAEARPSPRELGRRGLSKVPGLGRLAGGLVDLAPSNVVRALPDVVKVAGEVIWRTNQWTVHASLHIGDVVVRGAVSGQSPQTLVEQLSAEARQSLRELLGVAEAPDPMPRALRERINPNGSGERSPRISLPDRMNALLDASADLTYPDGGHPAYIRLLSELSPDEARVLRMFAQRGAQPSVDVRTKRPFGVGSELVAPGITMIGRYAGCRHPDRVPAYLNNLFRLGLIWFSREALPDQSLYDVLEAQEEVEAAMRRAGRGMTVRRSIELTAFGRNLCAMTGLLPPSDSAVQAGDCESTQQLPPPDAR